MFEILGIQIPAGAQFADEKWAFAGITDSNALKVLGESVKAAALAAAKAEGVTPDSLAEIKQGRAFAEAVAAELTARSEATAAFEAERDAELAALEGEDAPAAEAGDAAEGDEAEKIDPEAKTDEVEKTDEDKADEKVAVTASWKPTAAAAKARVVPAKVEVAPAKSGTYADATFVACTGVDGKQSGEQFGNLLDLASALQEAHEINKGSGRKMPVARTFGHFSEAQTLTEDVDANVAKFGGLVPGTPAAVDAVTAALCAPEEPLYELATTSSTARPVKGSLATYKPARGRVSVYPTPKLADIVDGRGIWTADNDADAEAVKAACATISCASPTVYEIYGLYRCLTIKNMLAMTFPELVEAYLNRLGAVTARLGDSTLLDAMLGSVNTKTVTATSNEYGAAINLFDTIITIAALYREEERYSDQQFDAWLPRWVKPALKVDISRMRRTSGRFGDRIPSDAELDAAFRDSGIDVTWTLDNATDWTPAPFLVDGEALPDFPSTISGIIAPKGNFRLLDRGDLSIGVAPGNIYRDNDSNTRNEFTIFQESFEGLIDFGATNWGFSLEDVCLNGAQVADVDAIVCGS